MELIGRRYFTTHYLYEKVTLALESMHSKHAVTQQMNPVQEE